VPKPFDASTKFLVEMQPEDWIAFLKFPPGAVHMEDADASTVTAAGDRILLVDAQSGSYGVHFEFQAGPDPLFTERLWQYNVLYTGKFHLPIRSVAFLLRPFDGHAKIRGRYVVRDTEDELIHAFHHWTIRVWQTPPDVFLQGGLALLPLAAVAKVPKRELSRIIKQIDQRLYAETKASDGELLRTATFVLLGLKYEKTFVEKIMSKNVLELSSTYQALMEEGKDMGKAIGLEIGKEIGKEIGREEGELEKAREMLVRLGRRRLGEPSKDMMSFLNNISDVTVLDGFADRLWDIESWADLLPTKS
jgi:hypothetical protein